MNKSFYIALLILMSGCCENPDGEEPNMTDKHEWSVVEVKSYKHAKIDNSAPYLIIKENEKEIIALPIDGQSYGYVIILAKAKGSRKVKAMPTVHFKVPYSVYKEIKMQVLLSDDVDTFIHSHISDPDCKPYQFDKMRQDWYDACANPENGAQKLGKCFPGMDPLERAQRIAQHTACLNARKNIADRCLAGGDEYYILQVEDTKKVIMDCGGTLP